ncbi:hypothetical protein Tco_0778461, partial [Tanacetum coccineum]
SHVPLHERPGFDFGLWFGHNWHDTWIHVACHVADQDPTRSRPNLDPDPTRSRPGPDPPVDWRSTTVDRWSGCGQRGSTTVDRRWPPLTAGQEAVDRSLIVVDVDATSLAAF